MNTEAQTARQAWQDFRERCSPERKAEVSRLISEGSTREEIMAKFASNRPITSSKQQSAPPTNASAAWHKITAKLNARLQQR